MGDPATTDRAADAREQEKLRVQQDLEQLRDLWAHMEWTREEERAALAREIHDALGQALTALKMDLAWLGRRLEEGETRPDLPAKVRDMTVLVEDTIRRVRRIARELRPGVLDDLGLEAAVEWQVQEFEARTGVACRLDSTLGSGRLDRRLSTAAFRILQEALTNVTRHARAHAVRVALAMRDGRLVLEVADDGQGLPAGVAESARSRGLLGMRERARRLAGELSVRSAPGQGTTVTFSVPAEERRAGGER